MAFKILYQAITKNWNLRRWLQRYQRKMRWEHTWVYVTISFFEDKEANAP